MERLPGYPGYKSSDIPSLLEAGARWDPYRCIWSVDEAAKKKLSSLHSMLTTGGRRLQAKKGSVPAAPHLPDPNQWPANPRD